MNNRKPTLQDIADKANVSIGTVDRSIHNRGRVSSATKEKVLAIAKELGYKKNIYASLLASKKRVINLAFLLPKEGMDPYWDLVLKGVKEAIGEKPTYNIQFKKFSFDLFNPQDFLRKAKKLANEEIDILLTAPIFNKEWLILEKIMVDRKIPYVIINTLPKVLDPNYICYIGPDAYQSGLLAGRLLSNHCQPQDTVIMIPLEKNYHNARHMLKKEEGFKDYFRKNLPDVEVITLQLEMYDNHEYLKKSLHELLDKYPATKGIYTSASRVHILAKVLEETQKKLILIGYDSLPANIKYLKKGIIDYLINQNPNTMGYLGMKAIQNYAIYKSISTSKILMPLDVVLPENYSFYLNKNQTIKSPILKTNYPLS